MLTLGNKYLAVRRFTDIRHTAFGKFGGDESARTREDSNVSSVYEGRTMKQIGILGAGGLAREVMVLLEDLCIADRVVAFYETDDVWQARSLHNIPVASLSDFDPSRCEMVLAVSDPTTRRALRERLPAQTYYPTLIHPSVHRSASVEIGEGSIVCAGAILTCDITVGTHALVDRTTNIGHDCRISDFVTFSPGVIVSGNCEIGSDCFFGAGALIREKTKIPQGTTVGMGAVVAASIHEAGTYFGNPARRRER
jgi:sugar O-acyltransferase (sialic acid O-acetyltransferase NeuD family)